MYKEIAKMVIYRDFEKDNILMPLAQIVDDYENRYLPTNGQSVTREELVARIYMEIHKLLDVATRYGFDKNLWHNYLTYLLVTNENPFSITSEKVGARDGSVIRFAKSDFRIMKYLFDYDFEPMERELGIDCFSVISDYHAIAKDNKSYNANVSEKVQSLSARLEQAADENEIFDLVTGFYRDFGVGKFGLNKAFRVVKEGGCVNLLPITNTEEIHLTDLVGYELQKKKLVDNTLAFVQGKKANNVLLFGDAGTGKSTSVKAILNEYYPMGLRIIEVYKHQFEDLSEVIAQIKNRNYRFIIYMDDLSFEEFEIEYKYLKAVIEGGLEIRPDNVLIYATSNRRHLIRETWNDRSDMEHGEGMHRSDTMQEKLSLVARFGVTINFSAPSQKEFFHIVTEIAKRYPEIKLSEEELLAEANKWELSHGGKSGRTAEQFITWLLSQSAEK